MKPEKIIIVGDLFHAELNSEIEIFRKWFEDFNTIKWLLVKGNHDRFSKNSEWKETEIYETENLFFSRIFRFPSKPKLVGTFILEVSLMAQNDKIEISLLFSLGKSNYFACIFSIYWT